MADANIYSVTFGERIQALTGFDADSPSNTFDSTSYQNLTSQWLKEGIMEAVKLLPRELLERAKTYFTFESNPAGAEVEVPESDVSNITLHDGSKMIECRQVLASHKGKLEDSTDILYATSTDPAYYLEGNKLNVLPYGYECRYGAFNFTKENLDGDELLNVLSSDSEITNFPSEAQDLVVLHASIKALEYLLSSEEDAELYIPMIGNLKQDYQQKINILKHNTVQPPQAQQGR